MDRGPAGSARGQAPRPRALVLFWLHWLEEPVMASLPRSSGRSGCMNIYVYMNIHRDDTPPLYPLALGHFHSFPCPPHLLLCTGPTCRLPFLTAPWEPPVQGDPQGWGLRTPGLVHRRAEIPSGSVAGLAPPWALVSLLTFPAGPERVRPGTNRSPPIPPPDSIVLGTKLGGLGSPRVCQARLQVTQNE